MAKFKSGDTVFFIESNRRVIEGKIKAFSAGFYTIIYGNSAIRLRESRLYSSKEEAEKICPSVSQVLRRNPWDYGH